MEIKGENQLYKWELVNSAWVVTPIHQKPPAWKKPQQLAKLDIELKSTAATRVTEDQKHYDE